MRGSYAYTILMVDDDPEDIEIFTELAFRLQPHITCLSARNGQVAFEKLQLELNSLPNLILLDLNMPVLSGIDFLANFTADSRVNKIPVIVWSTSNHQADMLKEKYNISLLQKPTSYKDLQSMVELILNSVATNPAVAA